MRTVRVEVRVGISVMRTMTARPPFDRTLYGAGSRHGESVFEWLGRIVSAVCPETMISCSDSQTVGARRRCQ